MDARFRTIAALAAEQHSVVSSKQLVDAEVSSSQRHRWLQRGLLERIGPRSFAIGGSEPTWMRSVVAGYFDCAPWGFVAGRAGSRLYGLDGFLGDDVELLVTREHRGMRTPATVRST